MKTTLTVLALFAFAPVLLAQEGPGEPEEFDIGEAMKKIEKLMGKAEKSLVESTSREQAAEASRKAVEEIDKLLKGNRKTGTEIVEKINEILDNLPRMQGGGGGQSPMPRPEDGEPREPKEGQEVGDRDPRNSRKGEPDGGQKEPTVPEKEEAGKPPPDEAKEKVPVDPTQEWLARLPDQVREDYLNGRFQRIPAKYRRLIEAWTRKMAEEDDD